MEDDKRVNYKLDAINKLINNLKLSISGNKEYDELGENNVIVNLDEISQKITELHEMVKAEFDEFENQHKSESDETQTLLTKKFDLVHSDLATISDKLTTIDTNIKNMSSALQGKFNALIAAFACAASGIVTNPNPLFNPFSSLINLIPPTSP